MADRKRQVRHVILGVALIVSFILWRMGAIPLVIVVGILYGAVRFAIGPLPRFIASRRYSIRWKILVAIAIIAGLFFFVSMINFLAMDYMHERVHEIEEIQLTFPRDVPAALDALNGTYHGLLFSLTPLFSVLAALIALCLGIAVALSVINPVRKMGQAMRRIASGDLSQAIEVKNKDELGELATSINSTAIELTRLQATALAEERTLALREQITQVAMAQEEERRRISRELHDSLGPSLAAIGNRLRVCQQYVRTDPQRAERELDEVTRSLKGHIQEIRELIYDLRPMALDQLGLVGAVRQQLERFGQETGIQIAFNTSGTIDPGPLTQITVFRVVQECLSNVHKHANASQVEVLLQGTDGRIEVTVRDNGQGFDPRSAAYRSIPKGVGLLSMQERAQLLGGELSVNSSPGGGCQVAMYIPTREAEFGTYTSPISR